MSWLKRIAKKTAGMGRDAESGKSEDGRPSKKSRHPERKHVQKRAHEKKQAFKERSDGNSGDPAENIETKFEKRREAYKHKRAKLETLIGRGQDRDDAARKLKKLEQEWEEEREAFQRKMKEVRGRK